MGATVAAKNRKVSTFIPAFGRIGDDDLEFDTIRVFDDRLMLTKQGSEFVAVVQGGLCSLEDHLERNYIYAGTR